MKTLLLADNCQVGLFSGCDVKHLVERRVRVTLQEGYIRSDILSKIISGEELDFSLEKIAVSQLSFFEFERYKSTGLTVTLKRLVGVGLLKVV